MPSKTKINNSTYSITGGKTCINGTSYQIAKGKSYIDGSNYNIDFYKYYWWKYKAVPFTNGYRGDNGAYRYNGSYTQGTSYLSELIPVQYTTVYTSNSSYYSEVAVTDIGESLRAQDYPEGTIRSTITISYQPGIRFHLYMGTYEVKDGFWESIGAATITEYTRSSSSAYVKGALIEIVGSNNQNKYSEGVVDSSRNYIYFRKY